MSIKNLLSDQVKTDQEINVEAVNVGKAEYDVDIGVTSDVTVSTFAGRINLTNVVGGITVNNNITLNVSLIGIDPSKNIVICENYGPQDPAGENIKINALPQNILGDSFQIVLRNNANSDATATEYSVFYIVL